MHGLQVAEMVLAVWTAACDVYAQQGVKSLNGLPSRRLIDSSGCAETTLTHADFTGVW